MAPDQERMDLWLGRWEENGLALSGEKWNVPDVCGSGRSVYLALLVTLLWRESNSHVAGLPGAAESHARVQLDETGLHGTTGKM